MSKPNGKLKHPNPGRMTKHTDISGMKEKSQKPAEVLAEGRGNTEWIVKDSSYI